MQNIPVSFNCQVEAILNECQITLYMIKVAVDKMAFPQKRVSAILNVNKNQKRNVVTSLL